MATIRLNLAGERVGVQLKRNLQGKKVQLLKAQRETANEVVSRVLVRGRRDISSAGKFGSRWTDGFQGKVTEGGGFIRVNFTQKVPYWRVFQYGAVIRGKPLLWIPLSFAKDAIGIRARDYPGRLFRVDRKGGKAPLLMTRAKGEDAQAKYFGKESVRIPKKFHLIEIIRDVAKQMATIYKGKFKNG